jgi:heme-degrading monooxygenase HmoA
MSSEQLAKTPPPPYYAVVFTSLRAAADEGYAQTAEEMVRLASEQPGYLGHESARGVGGMGITVSYWKDEASIASWKANSDHLLAQRLGREKWYRAYVTRVCKVERAYSFR